MEVGIKVTKTLLAFLLLYVSCTSVINLQTARVF